MSSTASRFAIPLVEELQEHAGTRVNARASVVGERASSLRYRLDRVDEPHCDGYTTPETPGFAPGVPIETKAVRLTHNGGTRKGRVGIHYGTHEQLEEAGGWYAVVLYVEVVVDGEEVILVLAMDLMPAAVVGKYVREDGGEYQKVRWDLLLEHADVDVDRWVGGGGQA